jgi:hypothetical protein
LAVFGGGIISLSGGTFLDFIDEVSSAEAKIRNKVKEDIAKLDDVRSASADKQRKIKELVDGIKDNDDKKNITIIIDANIERMTAQKAIMLKRKKLEAEKKLNKHGIDANSLNGKRIIAHYERKGLIEYYTKVLEEVLNEELEEIKKLTGMEEEVEKRMAPGETGERVSEEAKSEIEKEADKLGIVPRNRFYKYGKESAQKYFVTRREEFEKKVKEFSKHLLNKLNDMSEKMRGKGIEGKSIVDSSNNRQKMATFIDKLRRRFEESIKEEYEQWVKDWKNTIIEEFEGHFKKDPDYEGIPDLGSPDRDFIKIFDKMLKGSSQEKGIIKEFKDSTFRSLSGHY